MKHTIFIFLFAGLLFSCDPLDVKPTDLIPAEDALTTGKGLQAALVGVYDGLQREDVAQSIIVFGDLAADNLEPVGSRIAYREVFNNRITPSNIRVEGIWNAHYDVLNRANNILAQIDAVDVSNTTKTNIKGQLLFIRAFAHFNLWRLFGPVPIKTSLITGITDEELNNPRNADSEVYAQIMADLNEALLSLAGTGKGDPTIANEGAVLALAARVELFAGNYPAVLTHTEELMSFGYSLIETDLFSALYDESVDDDETIFEISFSDDDVNTLADYFQPTARFELAVTSEAAAIYNGEDTIRGDVSAIPVDQTFYNNKYTDVSLDSDNAIVLRYADVLLMRAEALNAINYTADSEAFDLINAVRNRANLDSLNASSIANQAAFQQVIMDERRKEFLGEGHRWYDLIRTNTAFEVLSATKNIEATDLLFPIPQSELDTNKHPEMTQNDGY
ncbi:MAG: RagB/SusD family nutrient uptake outer membrane protein [Cyclobacteriaceae bacterium]